MKAIEGFSATIHFCWYN